MYFLMAELSDAASAAPSAVTPNDPLQSSATRATRIGAPPRAKPPTQRMSIEESWKARAAKWGSNKPAFTASPPEWAQLLPAASNAAWHCGPAKPIKSTPIFDVELYGKLCNSNYTYVFYINGKYHLFEIKNPDDDTAVLRERSAQAAVFSHFNTCSAVIITEPHVSANNNTPKLANSTQAASVIMLDDNVVVLFRLSIDLDQGTLHLLFDEMELKPNYKPPFDFPAVLPNPGYTYSAEVINQQRAKLIQAAGAAYCSAPAAPAIEAYRAVEAGIPLTQPPKLPMFLEPTTFVVASASATNWDHIRKVIEDCCKWLHADHEWVPVSFSYQCISYARQAEVPFCINLYVDPKSATPRTVIEFQRLGGDGWPFLDVARAARYFLESTDLVEGGVAGARKTLAEFKPANNSEPPVRDHKAVEDAVDNALNMCTASYSDVQSEAAINLADLAMQRAVQDALLKHPKAIKQLICMLNPGNTPMTSTYRCAAATLNHMMGSGASHAQGLETAKRIFAHQPENWLSFVCQIIASCKIAQVLRECAALVGHIAYYLPDDVKADLKDMYAAGHLNALLEHHDETIQQHMEVVRQLVTRA